MSYLDSITLMVKHPLNKDKKLEAWRRILCWQIASRLVPGDIDFDWINSSKFFCTKGETAQGLHHYKNYTTRILYYFVS